MYISNINRLDEIRINEGQDKCKEFFYNTASANKREAVKLINDVQLSFACFYILIPMLSSLGFYQNLNLRKKLVINIIHQMLMPETYYSGNDYLSAKDKEAYEILLWMIKTSFSESDISDEYEQIIDIAAATLINIYNEKTILPEVADLIFKRNKKGKFINDLVWAYFNSKDIKAVTLIANRLISEDNSEVNLAKRLLNINDIIINKEKAYNKYKNWLNENDQFIYFTEECNQFKSKPVPVKADVDRKYLNKGVESYEKTPIIPENEQEMECLASFSRLKENEKEILSDYSYKLKKEDLSEWQRWISSPIKEQLSQAKREQEDFA